MLNLEDAIKNAVERICRDRNEDDKIYIHVSDLAGEAIRQHAKILHDMRRANEEAQELTKAKAEGRLVVLPCKAGDTIYRIISYKCNAVCNKLNACNSFIYNACKAEFYVCPGTFQLNDMWWIGKTVFLTREEAEKALSGDA